MSGTLFEADVPYEAAHPNALAIYCSDGRFTTAVEQLLSHLGHERLDTMTLPGGPALLNVLTASYSDSDAALKAASFLITGHGIERVVLLAHAGCGYYRARRPGEAAAPLRARQLEDLRIGAAAIRKMSPQIDVVLFYAEPSGSTVQFEEIGL